MTSEGHPYAIFRRALERRNVAAAWAAATDLPQLTLVDALALCLLVRDREPQRYGRVAVRWLARFCDEQPPVELDEAALVAAHLAAFRAPAPLAAARAFAELLDARGRRDLSPVRDELLSGGRRPATTAASSTTQGPTPNEVGPPARGRPLIIARVLWVRSGRPRPASGGPRRASDVRLPPARVWSPYGAQRAQPVATGRKWSAPKDG